MRPIHEWPEASNFLQAHLIKAQSPETGEHTEAGREKDAKTGV